MLRKHPKNLSILFSGGVDGEIRLWNLALRKSIRSILAHDGLCTGIAAHPSGKYFFSVSIPHIYASYYLIIGYEFFIITDI